MLFYLKDPNGRSVANQSGQQTKFFLTESAARKHARDVLKASNLSVEQTDHSCDAEWSAGDHYHGVHFGDVSGSVTCPNQAEYVLWLDREGKDFLVCKKHIEDFHQWARVKLDHAIYRDELERLDNHEAPLKERLPVVPPQDYVLTPDEESIMAFFTFFGTTIGTRWMSFSDLTNSNLEDLGEGPITIMLRNLVDRGLLIQLQRGDTIFWHIMPGIRHAAPDLSI
jgi:hypothetical protein